MTVSGKVKKEPRAVGGYELGVSHIAVINHTTEEYPISKKDHHVFDTLIINVSNYFDLNGISPELT